MSKSLQALQRLSLQNEQLSRTRLAKPVNVSIELDILTTTWNDFLNRTQDLRPQKHSGDSGQVWDLWRKQGFKLSALDPREVRTLCTCPKTATRPELVKALQSDGAPLKRTGCMLGLIFCYFTNWRSTVDQDALEALIRKSLVVYEHRNPLVLKYREHAEWLFSAQCASQLAMKAVNASEDPLGILEKFHVGRASRLASSTLVSAVQKLVDSLDGQYDQVGSIARLDYALTKLLVAQLPLPIFYSAISKLIMHPLAQAGPFQAQLRAFVLRHNSLGDPRLGQAKWDSIDKAATQRFLSWMAKENIVFFFNHVLPYNNENRRRKDFWLSYAGRLVDFQVALSACDRHRLNASVHAKDQPQFARLDHLSTSAFLMKFGVPSGGDIVVVEFSETGNAAHKFQASVFTVKAGGLRSGSFIFSALKHDLDDNRIIHRGSWEGLAHNKMAMWGVR